MALNRKIFERKKIDNTGFSGNTTQKSVRFFNKDGSANVHRTGLSFIDNFSVYHYLLNISNTKFFLFVVAFYTAINFIFAAVYYFFCLNNLSGIILGTPLENFEEAFFFSSQTLTTVGYGRISPTGLFANIVASLEALMGILTLAIMTGLLYGRFVKPKAHIKFSHNGVIAPFKDGKAFMFRLMPIKGTSLTDVMVQLTASLKVEEEGKSLYKYFPMGLQFATLNNLFLNWTVVHPIDEESPLFQLTSKDIAAADLEIMVYLKGFDENYANTVVARTSYTFDELVYDAKFLPMHKETELGTLVEVHKLNSWEKLE